MGGVARTVPYMAQKTARLELRVDPGLKARVEARAEELGQKTTTFVERALERALAESAPVSRQPAVRSSSSAKQGVKPIPKK